MIVKNENNKWYVLSDNGMILGVFETKNGADTFAEQYAALKQFSSTVRTVGSKEAMDTFFDRFKKADKGV